MPRTVFAKLNEEAGTKRRIPLQNPPQRRCGFAPAIGPKIAAARRLDIVLFNIQYMEGRSFRRIQETLDFLEQMKFKVIPLVRSVGLIREAQKQVEDIGDNQDSIPLRH